MIESVSSINQISRNNSSKDLKKTIKTTKIDLTVSATKGGSFATPSRLQLGSSFVNSTSAGSRKGSFIRKQKSDSKKHQERLDKFVFAKKRSEPQTGKDESGDEVKIGILEQDSQCIRIPELDEASTPTPNNKKENLNERFNQALSSMFGEDQFQQFNNNNKARYQKNNSFSKKILDCNIDDNDVNYENSKLIFASSVVQKHMSSSIILAHPTPTPKTRVNIQIEIKQTISFQNAADQLGRRAIQNQRHLEKAHSIDSDECITSENIQVQIDDGFLKDHNTQGSQFGIKVTNRKVQESFVTALSTNSHFDKLNKGQINIKESNIVKDHPDQRIYSARLSVPAFTRTNKIVNVSLQKAKPAERKPYLAAEKKPVQKHLSKSPLSINFDSPKQKMRKPGQTMYFSAKDADFLKIKETFAIDTTKISQKSQSPNAWSRKALFKPNQRNFEVEAKELRSIDKIVFNQDKTHYAVLWTEGGFSKFDVASIQVIQNIKTLPFQIHDDHQIQEFAEIQNPLFAPKAEVISRIQKPRLFMERRKMPSFIPPKKANNKKQDLFDIQNDCDQKQLLDQRRRDWLAIEQTPASPDQFCCLALQHKTKDYIAVIKGMPKSAVFVEAVPDYAKQMCKMIELSRVKKQQIKQDKSKAFNAPTLKKAVSKNAAMISETEVIYKKTFTRHFTEEISEIETVKESRYTVFCLQTKICLYSSNGREPFDIIQCCNPSVYSVISRSLSNNALLACLISFSPADYKEDSVLIKDYTSREEDLKIIKPFGNGYEIGGLSLDEEGHRLAVVSKDACYVQLYIIFGCMSDPEERKTIEPFQRFFREKAASDKIFKPIQMVVSSFLNPSADINPCDFILLSSCSQTTHMFKINDAKTVQQDKLNASIFSRIWAQNERSVIRLNVMDELQPSLPPNASPEVVQKAKEAIEGFPYCCFVEQQSGLLVLITQSGYCLKFQLEAAETDKIDPRFDKYAYLSNARYSHTPLQKDRLKRALSQDNGKNQQSGAVKAENQQAQEAVSKEKEQIKKPVEYKQPILRLKYKIDDFFHDFKNESRKRLLRNQSS